MQLTSLPLLIDKLGIKVETIQLNVVLLIGNIGRSRSNRRSGGQIPLQHVEIIESQTGINVHTSLIEIRADTAPIASHEIAINKIGFLSLRQDNLRPEKGI